MAFSLTGSKKKGAQLSSSVLDGRTLAEVFVKRVRFSPTQRVYLVKKGGMFRPVTWEQVHTTSLGVFAGLKKQGITKGDRVAILSNSRPEWSVTDFTIQTLGAVTVPVYQSSNAEDVGFILKHSGAKMVFAEDASQAEKLSLIFAEMGSPLPVVFFQPGVKASFPSIAFDEFIASPNAAQCSDEQKASAEALHPESLASIVYTSGTTGTPKGVCLPHGCMMAEIRSIAQEIAFSTDDMFLSFLPFAHVLGRVESFIPLVTGISLAFAESVAAVSQNIQEVKPTLLMSVPRIYEKIYAKILSDVEGSAEYKKSLFRWSVQVGRQTVRLRSNKQQVPLALQLKHKVADQLVFSKVREKLGGRLRLTVSGGAPLSQDLCEFFHACGVKILEGYGLTETMAAVAVNRPDDYRFGTVGRPIAWTHFRIASDGEIQVKGPAVFSGYYNDEKATQEALTPDGWFSTGDIGEFDEKGFLRITDRKKELIVTSGGKNIAPQKLENLIKGIPLVSQAIIFGDRQKYLAALVTLSEADAKRWAKDRKIEFKTTEDLSKHPDILSHIDKGIKAMNAELASYETVKKFKVLPHDFTLEAGEMTPSLKLKRKVILQRYKKEIDALF